MPQLTTASWELGVGAGRWVEELGAQLALSPSPSDQHFHPASS
jgi:hypothetical protein